MKALLNAKPLAHRLDAHTDLLTNNLALPSEGADIPQQYLHNRQAGGTIEPCMERSERSGSESPQQRLCDRLLSEAITPKVFLEEMWRLELREPSRDDARSNAIALKQKAVSERFAGTDNYFAYSNLVSVSLFHCGQLEAALDRDRACGFIEEAYAWAIDAEKHSMSADEYEEWTNYVGATLAYLRRDAAAVEERLRKLSEGANKTIVENLLRGLERRGEPDYDIDYSRFPTS